MREQLVVSCILSADSYTMLERDCQKVKVIYTGGTIGMIRNKSGALEPLPHELENQLRKHPSCNDVVYQKQIYGDNYETAPLILPEVHGLKRVTYEIDEYEPLLDSSNMSMDDWIRIANDLYKIYERYDGFVILHGTDTMPYTASALSFMLENLGKSVIITGSQIPIFQLRSDGIDNFITSVVLAGNFVIPEVGLYFNNKLYRGNRTVKIDSGGFFAFDSPNLGPLVEVGITIDVKYKNIFRPNTIETFSVHPKLSKNIGLLRIFPSITTETVKAFLQPPIEGVVLQTYGAGNLPSNRTDVVEAIRAAASRGVIVVNCTQCQKGGVTDAYATGKVLVDAGVIIGFDMTPEAALAKLAYVLAKEDWDLPKKKMIMQSNIRGELTGLKRPYKAEMDLADAVNRTLHLLGPGNGELDQLDKVLFPTMLCAAVEERSISKISELKSYGANLSGTNSDLRTPLHLACTLGYIEIVRHLLLQGASVHMRDRFGKTPLMDAIDFDRHDVISLLRKCGAHLTISSTDLGDKLCNAASLGLPERLKSYEIAGANLSQHDAARRTPLHAAVLYNQLGVVKVLLEHHVEVNLKDSLDFTPMALADKLGLATIKEALLGHVLDAPSVRALQ